MAANNVINRLLIAAILTLTGSFPCYGYEDQLTHPAITLKAIESSKLSAYLMQNYGNQFQDGFESVVNGQKIRTWLTIGSTAEDDPMCRASNHFHDPLKAWSSSGMTDMPSLLAAICYAAHFMPRYSNITWATGYLSPPPTGLKTTYPLTWTPSNWDKARTFFERALTMQTNSDREIYYAKTFEALGQVMHLLQEMAVPAYVKGGINA